MTYEPIEPISRADAEQAFGSAEPHEVVHALLGVALFDPDWRWVQRQCTALVTHPDVWVRRACATALLHLARIHRQLDMESALGVLNELATVTETRGDALDVLEEIRMYVRGNSAEEAAE